MEARSHNVGDKVLLRKYGDEYAGVVTKVGRNRVTVAFTTKAGRPKVFTVPGNDVPYLIRAV